MEKRIAIAVNPNAGNGAATKLADEISVLLQKKHVAFTIFSGQWPDSFQGFTDVWIVGGDGTLNYFINCYSSIDLPLVIFSGGTGNDFAWKLYGNISLQKQVEFVLELEPKYVDAATCNGRFYINTAGLGFDGNVLQSMKAIRLVGGHLGYYFIVLKKIFTFRESSFRIFSNNQLLADERFLLVSVANSSRTGGGFHVSPKASVNDGLIDLVLVKPLPIIKRLFYLPKIEKGNHLHLSFVHHIIGTEFTIECEREIAAQLDGDLIHGKQFRFELLKDRFLFRY